MKRDIHPKVIKTTITCACGNVMETWSTRKDMRVEVCSNCHPVYTGVRLRAAELGRGRAEKFRRKYGVK